MYVKCGSLIGSCKVFDQMKERDNLLWNTIMPANKRHGFPQETFIISLYATNWSLTNSIYIF
ncbi:hypothetical protein KI387_025861, partial [Taxus chinensis]